MSVEQEDHVLRLLERWYEALDRGEEPDLETLCADRPDLVARVREILDHDPLAVSRLDPPDPGDPADLRRLGPFTLKGLLGEGGMGRVYLAEQDGLRRPVALKVLRPDRLGDRRARARLEREATLVSGIDHANIVPIIAVGEERGHVYVAMKWLGGPSLDDARVGRLPAREAARIGAAIARALQEAHACGVLHRDVKPANVILDGDVPYLVDFGLAREPTSHTTSGQDAIVGTLAYVAPEQVRGAHGRLDARIDVFALGATLFELLTGRRLRDAEETEAVVRQILTEEPPSLGLARADRDLEAVVQRAIEHDPGRRYATAAELADDLERYMRNEPVRARRIGPVTRAGRRVVRHRRASATIGALLVVAAALAADATRRSRQNARLLRDGAAAVMADFERRDLDAAGERLSMLEASSPRSAVVATLRDELDARRAVEALIDLLMSRGEVHGFGSLARLVRSVEIETSSLAVEPRRAAIALVFARLQLDGDAATRDGLERFERRFGSTRASAALRALLDRPVDVPRAIAAESPLDHALTFVVLRLVGSDLATRRDELALAGAFPDDFHVQLARAYQYLDEDEPELALAALEALPRHRRHDPIVERHRVQIHLASGDLDAAEAAYERIPPADRSTWDHVNLLTILTFRNDVAAVEAKVEEWTPIAAGDDSFRLFVARWALQQGRIDDAMARLDDLARRGRWKAMRDEAEGLRLICAANDHVRLQRERDERESREGPAAGDDLERRMTELRADMRARAERLLAGSRLESARANASTALAEVSFWEAGRASGPDRVRANGEAYAHLRDAVRASRDAIHARLRLVKYVRVFIDAALRRNGRLDSETRERLRLARGTVGELFDENARGRRPMTPAQELEARYHAACLASLDEDTFALRAGLAPLRALGDRLGWAGNATWAAQVAAFEARLDPEAGPRATTPADVTPPDE